MPNREHNRNNGSGRADPARIRPWKWYHTAFWILFTIGCILSTGIFSLPPVILGVVTVATVLMSLIALPLFLSAVMRFFRGGSDDSVPAVLEPQPAVLAEPQPAEPVPRPIQNGQLVNFPDRIYTDILDNYANARHRALEDMPEQAHVCILGMGPTGLMTALRAYAAGATITVIEKRPGYTRDSILRVSNAFLFSGGDPSHTYAIGRSLFLNSADVFELQIVLVRLFSGVGFVDEGLDTVFDNDGNTTFHTITVRHFEQLLYNLLVNLQQRNPDNIHIFRPYDILSIQPEAGEVCIKNGSSDVTVTVNHITHLVNSGGAHGRLQSGEPLYRALFPVHPSGEDNTFLYQPSPSLAVTLETRDTHAAGRRLVTAETGRKLPAGFKRGAEYCINATQDPVLHARIRDRIALYESSGVNFPTKSNTLYEQRVVAGFGDREGYFDHPPPGTGATRERSASSREDLDIDLMIAEHGIRADIERMSQAPYFWHHANRLPLIRLFSTQDTIYLGMEIPVELLRYLNNNEIPQADRDQRLLHWIHLSLSQFFPQSFIEKLVVRKGGAFELQLSQSNHIMWKYDSGVQVFNLGDALATPHFLTGSGLESAAISVDRWLKYFQRTYTQDEYEEAIRRDVQERAVSKLEGLSRLNMFQPRGATMPRVDEASEVSVLDMRN